MQSILVLNSGSSTIKFSVFAINTESKNANSMPLANKFPGFDTNRPEKFAFMQGGEERATGAYRDICEDCERQSQRSRKTNFDGSIDKTYTGLIDKITTAPSIKIKSCHKSNQIILEKDLAPTSIYDSYENAIYEILSWLEQHDIHIVAAGHRVAHGGAKYTHAVPINDEVITNLSSLSPLAPLHQPYNLKGPQILKEKFQNIFQVACFDTSFHTTCNKLSQLFAIPKKLTEQGIRRYGFHGLSYEYIVSQLDKYLPQNKVNGKIIIAHLGQGASMCAINNKTSVATTLSFSALDGLPMGTRCGNIDPGVLLHLLTAYNMSVKEIETLLYKESGLLGVSNGISSDMRTLLASDSPDAKLAVDLFVYKIGGWIGMLAAELGGLDGLIFTAGIGENAPYIREKICEKAAWLGAVIDKEKNDAGANTINAANSKIAIHIIPTDEELTIAKNTFEHFSLWHHHTKQLEF